MRIRLEPCAAGVVQRSGAVDHIARVAAAGVHREVSSGRILTGGVEALSTASLSVRRVVTGRLSRRRVKGRLGESLLGAGCVRRPRLSVDYRGAGGPSAGRGDQEKEERKNTEWAHCEFSPEAAAGGQSRVGAAEF